MADDIAAPLTPPPADDYWSLSREPLTGLVFAAPLLALYEVGVLLQPPTAPRNGAEVWLREALAVIGFGGYYFLLPLLVVLLLLAQHHVAHKPWRVNRGCFGGMLLESLVLAGLLWLIAATQRRWFPLAALDTLRLAAPHENLFTRLVGFLGAGFYEELLFRLLLLPAVYWVLRQFKLSELSAWLTAIIGTALLFSLAHHIGPLGDAWNLRVIVFRTVAGIFFGFLFMQRGFGVTAWTHALYDIIVGLW